MEKSSRVGSYWKWPIIDDIHLYPFSDIEQLISEPAVVPSSSSTRGRNMTYRVPELASVWGH